MAAIELRGVTKRFDGGHAAVADVHLSIADGERLALVGPSGSGKSTLLRLIAGLDTPTSGRVLIGGDDVTDTAPERRDLAMVFQNYALYPHKTVRENLAFGLRMRRIPAGEIAARVARTAETLGISALLDRRPAQLSGGQRQRVALGRALVREPRAFLFDEPLSNLDPRLRGETRVELVELHARLGATMIYVTHDQEEAMTLGQRIAVLRRGRVEQVASPRELYERPESDFVAGFIGSPPMNLVPLDTPAARSRFAAPAAAARAGVRPQDVRLGPSGDGLDATVELVEMIGPVQHLHLQTAHGRLVAVVPSGRHYERGVRTSVAFAPEVIHYFDANGRRVTSHGNPT